MQHFDQWRHSELRLYAGHTPASGSFLVPFNTPLDLSFDINYSAFVSFADGHQSTLTYNFNVTPVPEPGTVALLSTGILLIAESARE